MRNWKIKIKETEVDGVFTLVEAMEHAKSINEFVSITNGELQFVGKFGVDEVDDPLYNGWISRKKDMLV
jgi:hypothetical protein